MHDEGLGGIEIALLGGIRAWRDGQPLHDLGYGKVRALLAVLAAERRQLRREWIAALLWPDLSPADGRRNLRLALAHLNKALTPPGGGTLFLADKSNLGLDPAANCIVDLEFLAQAPTACRDRSDAAVLAQAMDYYRGPFLGDFALDDNPEFQEWLELQREAWRRRALAMAETLCNYHIQHGPLAAATDFAERAVALASHDEAGHRRLAELLARAGCQSAALAQLQECERVAADLGVAPEAKTLALKKRLAAVAANDAPAAAPIAAHIHPATVLHCELPLGNQEGLDEIGEGLAAARALAEELLRQHGGHLVRHGADLVAYFGYPQASEHAALFAARAAFDLVKRLGASGTAVTVSLHSGPILTAANDGLPDAAGLTTRIGGRLLRAAAPGQVVTSDATRRLLGSFVRSEPLAPPRDLGLDGPMELFLLQGENRTVDRFPDAPLTPMVGRRPELAQLEQLFAGSVAGRAHVLLIRGEAGIGKSRLLRAFCERLSPAQVTAFHAHCDPRHTATPLHPLLHLLAEMAAFAPEAERETKRDALRRFVAQRPALPSDALPLLLYLFDLAAGDTEPVLRRPAQQLRRAIEDLLLDLLTGTTSDQPALIAIEDIHWADPSTLSFIGRLLARGAARPVMALFTARPPFAPPWPQPLDVLELHPLGRADTVAMIEAVAGDRRFDLTTTARMIALSDGVPLYVEELARMLAGGPAPGIPANLHDLLAARLAAVAEVRPIAQMAATIGREFTADLLRALLTDERAVSDGLRQLCASGLVQPLGGERYQFRHALLQETAYRSQTRSAREKAHRAIARLLPTRFPELIAQEPELLAHHLTASDPAEAVAWWLRAAQHALSRGANLEAIAHAEAGLALLAGVDPAARAATELALRTEQGTALLALSGYGSQQVAEIFGVAARLLTEATDPATRFRVLWGVWMGISSQKDFKVALELGEELFAFTRTMAQPELRAAGHYVMGNSLFWLARFAESQAHFEQAVALCDQLDHRAAIMLLGEDPAATSLAFLTWVRWYRGQSGAAVDTFGQALALARELGHPYGIGYALVFGTVLHRLRREPQRVAELAAELLALAEEHHLALWHAVGAMMLGWAQASGGDPAGIGIIEQTLAGMRTAMPSVRIDFLVPLIESYMAHGRHADALPLLDQCDIAATDLIDLHYVAELARLRGGCLLALGDATAAIACFRRAAELARSQAAPLLGLRALEDLIDAGAATPSPSELEQIAFLRSQLRGID